MYVDLEDQPNTKEKPAFLWLAIFLLVIVVIQTVWMPARDEAANESERAFYAACMAKEGERVIVESNAGSWQCRERHVVTGYGMARK